MCLHFPGPARKLGLSEVRFSAQPGPGSVVAGIEHMGVERVAVEDAEAEEKEEAEAEDAKAAELGSGAWLRWFF